MYNSIWRDSIFTQSNTKSINMGDSFYISNLGDKIDIQYNGLFGYTTNYTFARINNGFIFYDKHFRGVKVEKVGDKITVFRNNKKFFIASIN